jgi:hypothetical protein
MVVKLWPRGFQEVKVPRFDDNGTGWWCAVSSLDPRTSDLTSDSTVLRDVNLFAPLPLFHPFATCDLKLVV